MKEFTANKHLAESKIKAVLSKIMEDKIKKLSVRKYMMKTINQSLKH